MTLPIDLQERLRFLCRVLSKEVNHLDYAAEQVFRPSLSLETVEQLDQNPDFALKVEAFSSRFSRLQDTQGDKMLPALLGALGEPDRALLINLDKAEKYGWLDSSEQWIALRQLRNQMIHEYIENPGKLHSALVVAYRNLGVLRQFTKALTAQAESLLT